MIEVNAMRWEVLTDGSVILHRGDATLHVDPAGRALDLRTVSSRRPLGGILLASYPLAAIDAVRLSPVEDGIALSLRLKSGEDVHAGQWTDPAQAEAVGKAITNAAPLVRLEGAAAEAKPLSDTNATADARSMPNAEATPAGLEARLASGSAAALIAKPVSNTAVTSDAKTVPGARPAPGARPMSDADAAFEVKPVSDADAAPEVQPISGAEVASAARSESDTEAAPSARLVSDADAAPVSDAEVASAARSVSNAEAALAARPMSVADSASTVSPESGAPAELAARSVSDAEAAPVAIPMSDADASVNAKSVSYAHATSQAKRLREASSGTSARSAQSATAAALASAAKRTFEVGAIAASRSRPASAPAEDQKAARRGSGRETALYSLMWRGAEHYFHAVPGRFVEAKASIKMATGSLVRTFPSAVAIDTTLPWPQVRPTPEPTYFKSAPGCLFESPLPPASFHDDPGFYSESIDLFGGLAPPVRNISWDFEVESSDTPLPIGDGLDPDRIARLRAAVGAPNGQPSVARTRASLGQDDASESVSPSARTPGPEAEGERVARLRAVVGKWSEPTPPPRFPPQRSTSSQSELPKMRRAEAPVPEFLLEESSTTERDSMRAGLMQTAALPSSKGTDENASEADWAVDYYRAMALTQPRSAVHPSPSLPAPHPAPSPLVLAEPPAILRIPGFNDDPDSAGASPAAEAPTPSHPSAIAQRNAAIELIRSTAETLPIATAEYANIKP